MKTHDKKNALLSKLLTVIFWVVFVILLLFFEKIFIYKDMEINRTRTLNSLKTPYNLVNPIDGFYTLDRDSLDVVFIGSSIIFFGVNPNILFEEYGITSYDYTSSSMRLDTMEYALREVFRSQSPKVVVFESTLMQTSYDLHRFQAFIAPYSPLSLPKIRFALGFDNFNSAIEILSPITTYHARWKEVTASDLAYPFSNKSDYLLGFMGLVRVEDGTPLNYAQEPIDNDSLPEPIPEYIKDYIDRFRSICEDNGAQAVFVVAPGFLGLQSNAYLNSLGEYVEGEGAPFINYNQQRERLAFDENDVADPVHLTLTGAEKFTLVLGSDIVETYGLDDRRGSGDCSYFEDCLEKHNALMRTLSQKEDA